MIGGISYTPIQRQQQTQLNPSQIPFELLEQLFLGNLNSSAHDPISSNEIITQEYVPQFNLGTNNNSQGETEEVDVPTPDGPLVLRQENFSNSDNKDSNIPIDNSYYKSLISNISVNAKNYNAWNEVWKEYGHLLGIKDEKAYCYLLGQLLHESDSFNAMGEYASGENYEGRKDLGNIHPGDGKKYKGRGPIQVTGRDNYEKIYENFFVPNGLGEYDIVNKPELADDPKIASLLTIGWLSQNKNAIKAANRYDVKSLTKNINGGYNGYSDRIKFTNSTLKNLGEFNNIREWLKKFTYSDTAAQHNIDNVIPDELLDSSKNTIKFFLDLQKAWGSDININSGYRSPELNKKLKGSNTSAHLTANAIDMYPENGDFAGFVKFLINYLRDKNFDQAIIEKKGSSKWVHLGLYNNNGKQRKHTFYQNVT